MHCNWFWASTMIWARILGLIAPCKPTQFASRYNGSAPTIEHEPPNWALQGNFVQRNFLLPSPARAWLSCEFWSEPFIYLFIYFLGRGEIFEVWTLKMQKKHAKTQILNNPTRGNQPFFFCFLKDTLYFTNLHNHWLYQFAKLIYNFCKVLPWLFEFTHYCTNSQNNLNFHA